ncbi:MAG: hypothetical protein WC793_01920 [Candidatus Paceibacterota bacterium]|jgi:hypothetical protein
MIRKILPYIIIFIALIGLFSPISKINAQQNLSGICKYGQTQQAAYLTDCQKSAGSNGGGTWTARDGTVTQIPATTPPPAGPTGNGTCNYNLQGTPTQVVNSFVECQTLAGSNGGGTWTAGGVGGAVTQIPAGTSGTTPTGQVAPASPGGTTPFEVEINKQQCGFGVFFAGGTGSSIWPGCAIQISYGMFYTVPAFFLYTAAYFFNILVFISLGSGLFTNSFISQAWGVVRDLSNLFFILVLLYIAIKLIIGLGGSDVKKMIAKVIVVALLINFSMFFTQVIIDASNILALTFYNKLSVYTKDAQGNQRKYVALTGNETDIAGGLVGGFNPTTTLTEPFFSELRKTYIDGHLVKQEPTVPAGMLIAISILAGSLMYYTVFVLWVAGFAFLVRLVELWFLIIFSPFAFMSSSVPILGGLEYIGWDSWLKRLLKTAFMAPIFMFFLYFIFLLLHSNIFSELIPKASGTDDPAGAIKMYLGVFLPLILVNILLYKAMMYAVKSSGKVGEVILGAAKTGASLALGAVTGGTAMLATGTIGKIASTVASSENLKKAGVESKGIGGFLARTTLKAADYGQKASFDFGKSGAGKALSKASGLDFSRSVLGLRPNTEGGFKGAGERKSEALKEESKLYKTGKSDKEVEEWSKKHNVRNSKGEYYTKADELNRSRMEEFRDDILVGAHSLLGALAYSTVNLTGEIIDKNNFSKDGAYRKRYNEAYKNDPAKLAEMVYDSKIANDVNHKRVMMTKMAVGGTAAVLTGGAVGGVAAGAMGMGTLGTATGVTGGMGVGGISAGDYAMKEAAGESKFTKELEKGFKKMSGITDRIAENIKSIDKLHESLDKFIEKDASGKDTGNGLVTGDKDKGFTVNTGKIESELTKISFAEKMNEIELKRLVEQEKAGKDDPRVVGLFNETIKNGERKFELTKLKTAEKDLHNLKKENLDLGKDKSALEKEQEGGGTKHKEDKKSHEAPKENTAHKTEEEHEEEKPHEKPTESAHTPPAAHGHT